jgi:hypothetical protein
LRILAKGAAVSDSNRIPRTCEFSRSMVGSAGTRQPAARCSEACRRACPAHDAGVHLRPRLGPTNSLSAVRVRGRRAVVKGVSVRPPNVGQAAADHARPRLPSHPAFCPRLLTPPPSPPVFTPRLHTLQIGAFCFTNELAKRGYVWQFITLAGFHSATVSRTSKAVLSKSGISK